MKTYKEWIENEKEKEIPEDIDDDERIILMHTKFNDDGC